MRFLEVRAELTGRTLSEKGNFLTPTPKPDSEYSESERSNDGRFQTLLCSSGRTIPMEGTPAYILSPKNDTDIS